MRENRREKKIISKIGRKKRKKMKKSLPLLIASCHPHTHKKKGKTMRIGMRRKFFRH